jgi:hypothetical protein
MSKGMTPAERNYEIYDRELLAVVTALKHWRKQLLGAREDFEIWTDHKNLQYFRTPQDINRRQARWIGDMAEYHFTLHHIEGVKNKGADGLSRRADHNNGKQDNKDISVLPGHLFRQVQERTIMEEIVKDMEGNKQWGKLKKKFVGEWTEGEQGLKYWRGRVYVPRKETRERIMKELHDHQIAGHPGEHKMYESIFRTFWWPTLRKDIKRYITGCETCQRTQAHHRTPTTLTPSEIPNTNWQRISVDLIGPLPKSNGHDAVMVVVDYLSKMGHFIPCSTTITAEGAARLYVDNVFKTHGLSESITSDRGPQFVSSFAQGFATMLGIERRLSTAYHPQTDGQTERTNREVEQYLRRFVNYEQDDWSEWLPLAEFTYNDHISSSTGHSPFYLNYGTHPWKGIAHIPPHPNESAKEFVTRMHTIREEAQAARRCAQEDMVRFYARHHPPPKKYQVGEQVWLEGVNLTTLRPTKKLEHKRFGPFKVLKCHGTAYRLDIPKSWKHIHPVFHETLLSPHHTPAFSSQAALPLPPAELIDDHPEYEVESILRARRWGRGIRFLVHWKGYPHEDDTWEPRTNLLHAKEALTTFYSSHPEAPRFEDESSEGGS